MVLAVDFSGLHVWADALATILLIELCVVLLIIAALMAVLAFGARWVQMHVVPLLNTTVPVAKSALQVTNQSTDKVVQGVAEVYGVRSAVVTAARVMLFGKDGARRAGVSQPAAGAIVSPPTEAPASPMVLTPRPTPPAAGRVGPTERRSEPPTPEPRQPSQPYDNMAAHAS